MLDHDVIIEVLSEAHDTAILNRLIELGYVEHSRCERWEKGRFKHPYIVVYNSEGYSAHATAREYYPNHKKVTLDYLYMEHEDKKTKEIKERIKKCEEELAKLRGEL